MITSLINEVSCFFSSNIACSQVLKFNLTESGLLCVLPWLTMAVFANIGGWIADTLVSKGLSITAVRKASAFTNFEFYAHDNVQN